jgi:hypothetical protein
MRKISILLFVFNFIFGVAQNMDTTLAPSPFVKTNFLGFGTGVNASAGYIGITSELLAQDQVFIRFGAGIGAWGAKFAFGFKIQKQKSSGPGFSVYYNYSTGLKNVKTDLEVKSTTLRTSGQFPVFVTTIGVKPVTLNYLPAGSFNFALSYNLVIET